jgi:hypothetical protein
MPISIRRRGGRKQVLAPDGTTDTEPPIRRRIDNAMAKAVARAFRWRKLLETGVYSTVQDIATAEKINPSYVSRILRLTLLEPAIVEAILGGRKPANLQLEDLLRRFPVEWQAQGDERSKLKGLGPCRL